MGSMSDKIIGKSKQMMGRMTHNKELEAKGKAQEMMGDVKGEYKEVSGKIDQKF